MILMNDITLLYYIACFYTIRFLFLYGEFCNKYTFYIHFALFYSFPFWFSLCKPSLIQFYRCYMSKAMITLIFLSSFHTYDYARHFVSACTRILELEGTPEGVEYQGRLTRVAAVCLNKCFFITFYIHFIHLKHLMFFLDFH